MATRKKQLLYMQLKEHILEDYQNKAYYSPLPGERELCDIYNVSRPTVRKAFEILEDEGCIVRFPGKGAFYIGEKQTGNRKIASSNIAFYNQVRLRGDYTSSKVLTQKAEIVCDKVAGILGLVKDAKVFHLERLRYINGTLWTIADAYLDYELCPELLEYDFAERSLHNTLAFYGYVPFRAKRHITAKRANEYEAFNLGLKKDDILCVTETLTYDQSGRLLEYSFSRGDIFNMAIDLTTFNQTNVTGDRSSEAERPSGHGGSKEISEIYSDEKSVDIDALLW